MIEFILNNDIIRTDIKTGTTLLSFIRENQGLKGTKSGCKEGDCGACTVLSGELNKTGKVDYKSIVSCLTPLANVHNKHIVTVEGLNLKDELNIAQLAIKNHHGTQCGFCTPGFVVSLTNYAIDKDTLVTTKNHLSGNICRCTGYKSIEKAALSVEEQLKHKNIDHDIDWLIENKFIPEYFKEIPSRLKELDSNQSKTNGQLIAGGTDVNVRFANDMADQNINPANSFVPKDIVFKNNIYTIGAGATVSDIYNSENFNKYFPDLKKHLKLVSSIQIRNMVTISFNFVNA
jgi:xanthine dehydrogenase small subunit